MERLGRTTVELGLIDPAVSVAAGNGAVGGIEPRLPRKSGHRRWVELSGQSLAGGALLLSLWREITDRKVIEERVREALGTYLDNDVVKLILAGRVPQDGLEVSASLMFVDARNFTGFTERYDAKRVVAHSTNFRDHGANRHQSRRARGEFLGDGLLAVFGALEDYRDHADRALRAGTEIVEAVNQPGVALPVAVGINMGRVMAGSIGGAAASTSASSATPSTHARV